MVIDVLGMTGQRWLSESLLPEFREEKERSYPSSLRDHRGQFQVVFSLVLLVRQLELEVWILEEMGSSQPVILQ